MPTKNVCQPPVSAVLFVLSSSNCLDDVLSGDWESIVWTGSRYPYSQADDGFDQLMS